MGINSEKNIYYFFLFIFLLIIGIVEYLKLKKCKDHLDIFSLFTATYFLYSSVGLYGHLGEYDISVTLCFYQCVILGYLSFSFFYIKTLNKNIEQNFQRKKYKYKNFTTDILILFFFAFFIFLNFDKFLNMFIEFGTGSSYIKTALRSERTIFSGPKSLLNYYFKCFILGYPAYRMFKDYKIRLLDITIFLVVGMYAVTSGDRTTILYIVFIILIFINYRYKKIKFIYLVLLGIFGVFFLIALGHLRRENNIIQMFQMFMTNKTIKFISPTSSGEFINTSRTFFNYIEEIKSKNISLNFGYTWLREILIFIPTFLWNNRPIPWAEQYMLDFYPEIPRGIGHGWYILNDGYMSFGLLGVLLEMGIMGFSFSKVYIFFMKKIYNPVYMYMYTILLIIICTLPRASFLGLIKNYFLNIFLLIMIIQVSKIKLHKNN